MPKEPDQGKKLGRDQVIKDDDLLKRYGAQKEFVEYNWGRIGLKLQRVRKPADVSSAFRLIPRIESYRPFREHKACCLINDCSEPVLIRNLRTTQGLHDEAVKTVSGLWTEFHNSSQELERGKTSLKIALAEVGTLARFFPVFYFVFAMDLHVQKLRENFVAVQLTRNKAQQHEEELRKKRTTEEAWFAQNEIIKFKRSRRYAVTAINFARATAGMPEYGWLNSLRRCERLTLEPWMSTPYTYQVFELLQQLVRRLNPLRVHKMEKRLLHELLSQERTLLRETIKPHWWDLKRAFADCRGKRFTRRELPYLVVGRFLKYLDAPKSLMEAELAKHAEAELTFTGQS